MCPATSLAPLITTSHTTESKTMACNPANPLSEQDRLALLCVTQMIRTIVVPPVNQNSAYTYFPESPAAPSKEYVLDELSTSTHLAFTSGGEGMTAQNVRAKLSSIFKIVEEIVEMVSQDPLFHDAIIYTTELASHPSSFFLYSSKPSLLILNTQYPDARPSPFRHPLPPHNVRPSPNTPRPLPTPILTTENQSSTHVHLPRPLHPGPRSPWNIYTCSTLPSNLQTPQAQTAGSNPPSKKTPSNPQTHPHKHPNTPPRSRKQRGRGTHRLGFPGPDAPESLEAQDSKAYRLSGSCAGCDPWAGDESSGDAADSR